MFVTTGYVNYGRKQERLLVLARDLDASPTFDTASCSWNYSVRCKWRYFWFLIDSCKAEIDRAWLSRFTPKLTAVINCSGKNLLLKGFSYVRVVGGGCT